MRDLLAAAQPWALRTARINALAAAAVGSDAVEKWGRKSRDRNWLAMRAEVLAQRALHAHGEGRWRDAYALADSAYHASAEAEANWPEDPAPKNTLLALARLDVSEHRAKCWWEPMMPLGPWDLLDQVQRRAPYNREAWHRMMEALDASGASTSDFSRWAQGRAPNDSPVRLLPLYANVEIYRRASERGKATRQFWAEDGVWFSTRQAAESWSSLADRTAWSPLDLNHLAHALHYGRPHHATQAVFDTIGGHVTRSPWNVTALDPHRWPDEFSRARRLSMRRRI
ncbi:hypothetical protein ACWEQC_39680 [Streptomyces shenzhenensis]